MCLNFHKNFIKIKFYGLLSVLILEGIYFYNYTTPEFNVYITELPFWTLTDILIPIKLSSRDNFKDWFLLGFFAAIGILSHYLFSYLLLSISLFF